MNARRSSTRPRPSKLAQAVLRELYGTQMRSSMLSGRSIGLNESVCGQIGVMRSAGTSGCTSEPPAESWRRREVSACEEAVAAACSRSRRWIRLGSRR